MLGPRAAPLLCFLRDVLGPLRKAWVTRLLNSGFHQRISSRLLSGSKDEPVSTEELRPFLEDLRRRAFLHVDSDDTWASLLSVLEGQPFRLNVWHCSALLSVPIPTPTIFTYFVQASRSGLDRSSRSVPLCIRPLLPI